MTIIRYTPQIKIKNVEAMPGGLKCNFLVCLIAHTGDLVATQWKRTAPRIESGYAVVCFTDTAMKQAQRVNR